MRRVEEIVRDIVKRVGIPEEYSEAIALSLISSILNYDVRITDGMRIPKPLGLWILFVGPSRLGRKTTTRMFIERVVEKVVPGRKFADEFSPEAMFDELTQNPNRLITIDEFGYWMRKTRKKDWVEGVKGILNELYDYPHTIRRRLRSGVITVRKPYVEVLAFIPTAQSYELKDEDFGSGFLNRFAVTIAEAKIRRSTEKVIAGMSGYVGEEELVERLKEILKIVETAQYIMLTLNDEAEKIFSTFSFELDKLIEERARRGIYEPWDGYYAEMDNWALRAAGLYRLSRLTDMGELVPLFNPGGNPSEDEPYVLFVEGEDMRKGVEFVETVKRMFEDFITQKEIMGETPKKMDFDMIMRPVLKVIEAAGGVIHYSELLRRSHMKTSELREVLADMYERGLIYVVDAKKIQGGYLTKVVQKRPHYVVLASRISEVISSVYSVDDLVDDTEKFIKG